MWGVPTAWLSMGYLFIIYGVRELSQDMEGAGGQCRCWWGTEGWHQALTSTSWLCLCPKRGWQGVAGGCGSRHGAGWGWWPWDHVHVPSGDTEVSGGASLQVSTQRCLQAFLPLPVQPFSLLALAPHPQATGPGTGGEGGSGLPPGPSWRRTFTFTAI